MNIVRTTALELSTIPAIVYKQKLASGGSGIKMHRLDQPATSVFTIDRRTGEAVPYGTVDHNLFPHEAIDEALELTLGLPYSARGKLTITSFSLNKEAEDVEENETEKVDMVPSDEYCAIVSRYQNEKGKINYALMNKDFIQFAAKSKIVANMVADKALGEDILTYIIKNRAAYIADKKDDLSDKQVAALIETLDEIDPRSAFKELKAYIRRMLSHNR